MPQPINRLVSKPETPRHRGRILVPWAILFLGACLYGANDLICVPEGGVFGVDPIFVLLAYLFYAINLVLLVAIIVHCIRRRHVDWLPLVLSLALAVGTIIFWMSEAPLCAN